MKTVLSSALSRAVREELVTRNVARSVDLPEWRRRTIQSWTVDEAKRFVAASRPGPFYAAFVLLVLCGMRRGEVWACAGATLTSTPGPSMFASRSSASATSSSSAQCAHSDRQLSQRPPQPSPHLPAEGLGRRAAAVAQHRRRGPDLGLTRSHPSDWG